MGSETQEGNGNLKFVNFKIWFSNNDMYGFVNSGINIAEKWKHSICLLYEFDWLENTTTLGTVHLNVCFKKYEGWNFNGGNYLFIYIYILTIYLQLQLGTVHLNVCFRSTRVGTLIVVTIYIYIYIY